jgi:hypothetical protein
MVKKLNRKITLKFLTRFSPQIIFDVISNNGSLILMTFIFSMNILRILKKFKKCFCIYFRHKHDGAGAWDCGNSFCNFFMLFHFESNDH